MATTGDDLILEGEFTLLSKKKVAHRVTLTRNGFFFHPVLSNNNSYEEKCVKISDIVGCHGFEQCRNVEQGASSVPQQHCGDDDNKLTPSTECTNSEVTASRYIPQITDASACGIVVFAYPFRKKVFSSKKVRAKQVLVFEVPPASVELDERQRVAESWRSVINCLCRGISVNVNDIPNCVPPPRGRMLLLINPHSGPGKAHTIFKNEIAPMLFEASIPYKAVITEYAGHASDLMKTINLSEWYGVVIVSGDGLIFETINGIMQRDDWATSIKFPVGCLPAGSGNALSCSINYAAGEPLDSALILHSTFVLVKHSVVPMDLVLIHIPDRTLFSFLSVTWGIVADIDFESEKYRALGETRFTVGAIKRIIGLRSYRGRVSFLPVAEYTPKVTATSNKVLAKVRRFSLDSRSSSKSNSEDSKSSASKDERQQTCGAGAGDSLMKTGFVGTNGDVSAGCDPHESASCDPHGGRSGNDGSGDASHIQTESSQIPDSSLASQDEQQSHFTSSQTVPPESIHGSDVVVNESTRHPLPSHDTQLKKDSVHSSGGHVNDSSGGHVNDSSGGHVNDSSGGHVNDSSGGHVNDSSGGHVNDSSGGHVNGCSIQHHSSMTIMAGAEEISVQQETYHVRKPKCAPVPTPLLRPLDQGVPVNWVTLDENFILAIAVYQTHLGSDMLAAPDAHLSDGHIHLIMIKEGISRNALLNLFLTFGQGRHISSPYVDVVKVLAFRIEPATKNGNIMVDGERFDPTPIQGQILPGLARVMAIR